VGENFAAKSIGRRPPQRFGDALGVQCEQAYSAARSVGIIFAAPAGPIAAKAA
jgi:hypothetical protein